MAEVSPVSSARPLAILPGYSDSPATQMEPTGCAVDTYLSSGTTPPRHRHDSYELFILYSGAAVLSTQHGREVLTPGDAALFYGGTLHGARSVTGMYRRTAIHFVSDRLSTAISDQLPAAGEGLRAFSLPAETLEKLLRDAKGLRALSDAGDAKRTTMMLEKIFRSIEDDMSSRRPRRHLPPILQAVVQYMVQHPKQTRSTGEIASKFYISEGHLYRLFQQYLRCTPQKLWLYLKIESACDMLLTGKSIDEAAKGAGFATRRGFERAFLRITGLSPASYRDMVVQSL